MASQSNGAAPTAANTSSEGPASIPTKIPMTINVPQPVPQSTNDKVETVPGADTIPPSQAPLMVGKSNIVKLAGLGLDDIARTAALPLYSRRFSRRGGKRPNAGRKKKPALFQNMRDQMKINAAKLEGLSKICHYRGCHENIDKTRGAVVVCTEEHCGKAARGRKLPKGHRRWLCEKHALKVNVDLNKVFDSNGKQNDYTCPHCYYVQNNKECLCCIKYALPDGKKIETESKLESASLSAPANKGPAGSPRPPVTPQPVDQLSTVVMPGQRPILKKSSLASTPVVAESDPKLSATATKNDHMLETLSKPGDKDKGKVVGATSGQEKKDMNSNNSAALQKSAVDAAAAAPNNSATQDSQKRNNSGGNNNTATLSPSKTIGRQQKGQGNSSAPSAQSPTTAATAAPQNNEEVRGANPDRKRRILDVVNEESMKKPKPASKPAAP